MVTALCHFWLSSIVHSQVSRAGWLDVNNAVKHCHYCIRFCSQTATPRLLDQATSTASCQQELCCQIICHQACIWSTCNLLISYRWACKSGWPKPNALQTSHLQVSYFGYWRPIASGRLMLNHQQCPHMDQQCKPSLQHCHNQPNKLTQSGCGPYRVLSLYKQQWQWATCKVCTTHWKLTTWNVTQTYVLVHQVIAWWQLKHWCVHTREVNTNGWSCALKWCSSSDAPWQV